PCVLVYHTATTKIYTLSLHDALPICSTYKGRSKIIMVLDNVRFHHARYVQEWLSGQDQLELFFLPPYSPDLNAVEKAWWYMRKKDRKSTRLNSSHVKISYAVFCLKKK